MFTYKELELIHYISRGITDIGDLSEKLGLSQSETYRIIRNLKSKDVLKTSNKICINSCAFAKRLFAIMSKGPEMARFFSDGRIYVLLSLLNPKTIQEISLETGISESHLHKILKIQTGGTVVRKIDGYYSLNSMKHPQIKAFLISLIDHLDVCDPRIPDNSILLFREGGEVVYSMTEMSLDQTTGFSALEDYGLTGWSFDDNYYTTKEDELTLDQIFEDAIRIAETEDSTRMRMANEIFYMKRKEELNPPKEFLDKHNRILAGERIEKWPSLTEIQEKLWTVTE
ncbi:MAG: helix-turn-helix transcriptional regulator [Candidatus Methanomethylophilaceae archaeon]|nr:helix-turn-helix transcriptional regulator [Candidatus Methanomethylophilaceae archaeon]